MEINKNNYEEFFLLYVDGELNAAGRTAVEKFAEQYADLQEELDALLQTRLAATDEFTFENKASLYKYEGELINNDNYQEYLLSYIDNELNNEEKRSVEALIKNNPGKKAELDILQMVKLDATEKIVFENKTVLYRTEKERARVLPLNWIRVAAAASVILIASVIWFTTTNDKANVQPRTLAETSTNPQPQIAAKEKDITTVDTRKDNVVDQPVDETTNSDKTIDELPGKKQKAFEKINKEISVPDKTAIQTENKATVIPDPKVTITDKQPVMHENVVAVNQKTQSNSAPVTEPAVKPVIIDQAAFNGNKDVAIETGKQVDAVENIDADNTDKKSKGKLRGLFRKAARFIDRTTNADTDGNQSIVRVASFEIAKK